MVSTTVEADAVGLPRAPRVDPRAVWLALSGLLVLLAVWQVARGGVWRPTFFFDEMWRVDFIRSANIRDEMLTHGTPIPYGWLVLMRGMTMWLPYEPVYWRAIAGLSLVLGLLIIGVLLMRLGRPEQRLHPMVCAVSAAALAFMAPVHPYFSYFTNYGFEVLYTALLLLAAMELSRSRWALPSFCALVALAPFLVIGPLFVVPALAVHTFRWARRTPVLALRRRRIGLLLGTGVVALLDLVFVYLYFYRQMDSTSQGLKSYWVQLGGSLGGDQSVFGLLGSLVSQLSNAVAGQRAVDAGGVWLDLATLVVLVGTVIGVVTVARRWPMLLIAVLSAQLLTIPASAATGWPINVQRVNLAFQVFLLAVMVLGLVHGVLLAVQRLRWPVWRALPAFGLLLVALWFPHVPAGDTVFGRGLYSDLGVVAHTTAPRNLVFLYHPMSRFTAHDRLINTPIPGHTFDLVNQHLGDNTLYQPLDPLVAQADLRPGDAVWCVMPFEIGPTSIRMACQFSGSSLEPLLSVRGARTVLRGYLVR